MKIKVDDDKCIGCGLCANICEEVFSLNNEGKAIVKAQKNIPCVKEAIENCPVSAISE